MTSLFLTLVPIICLTVFPSFKMESSDNPFENVSFYLLWASFQQALILVFIFPRIEEKSPNISVIVCAGVFAYTHFPNFSLMMVTFFVGEIWTAHYKHYSNWYAIVLSHTILGVVYREACA
jgi:membrane protease YdiL (CAAX protease family)